MDSFFTSELAPIFWLLLGIALAVMEAASIQLVAIWFSLGAVVTIIPAMLGAPVWVQLMVFAVVSGGAMAGTRPFVKRFLSMRGERTNADRVIGQVGVVIVPIDNDTAQGRVSAMGLDWAARMENGARAELGEKVTVLAIEGVTLTVRKIDPPTNRGE